MRLVRRFWWIVPLVIVIAAVGFIAWASTTNPLEPAAETALVTDSAVTVDSSRWLVFKPSAEATTGLIFYPGGKVNPAAYAPLARAAAEAGYLAVIVPMPLNLAILDTSAADAVIDAFPSVEHWALAGHSLGGSMAARYAAANPDKIDGLALIAAFSDVDLSGSGIATRVIYGTRDGLATVEEVEGGASLLPADAAWVKIDGGNHGQFGWYGEQAGDNPATISHEEQAAQTTDALLALLARIS